MRSQRWEWTHTYGVHLLVASVVSVVLAGTGLFVVAGLGGDPDEVRVLPSVDPTLPPASTPAASPPPPPPSPTGETSPTVAPVAVDPGCMIGTWQAVELEDIGWTGTWFLVAGGPTFEYRDDGTGVIDYGDPTGDFSTTFDFVPLVGAPSNSVPSGQRPFDYVIEQDAVLFAYQDLFGGARMLGIPYLPSEDTFNTVCDGDTMTLRGDNGLVDLRRQGS